MNAPALGSPERTGGEREPWAWSLSWEAPACLPGVNENLISRAKKELEIFIRAKFEAYYPGRASQKALRMVPPIGSQDTVYISFLRQGCTLNDVLLTVYVIQIGAVGHVIPYKTKKECYLLRS